MEFTAQIGNFTFFKFSFLLATGGCSLSVVQLHYILMKLGVIMHLTALL